MWTHSSPNKPNLRMYLFSWMKIKVEEAEEKGVIKPVEKIKLEDEEKKQFKRGISYDDFSTNPMVVAFVAKQNVDNAKVQERLKFSNYLYNPLSRSFKSVVRITALVLKAVKSFKKFRILKLVKQGKLNKESLKEFDVKPIKFSVFTASISTVQDDDHSNQEKKEVLKNDSPSFFTSKYGKLSNIGIILTEEDLDAALT